MRTASRVFGAIGIFAFVAALLFLAAGRDRDAVQGTLVLGLFGVANIYLWRVLGHSGRDELDGLVVPGARPLDEVAHNEPESIHLPGPSIMPVIFALAAGLILIGLFTHYALSYAGLALFVVASVGWIREAVGEHRLAEAHGGHDDHHPTFDHAAIELAHRIRAFGSAHGGATANVQHLGRGRARVVLVGADGEWGDLVTDDLAVANQACALSGVETAQTWPAGLGRRMRTDQQTWRRMGGASAPATVHGPRDGYLQVGARVFFAIGFFAFFAAILFFASGGGKRSTIQGTLILAMFGIANMYLYVFMRNARGGPADQVYAAPSGISAEPVDPGPAMNPDEIHLPGPSIWPAVFALAGGMILIGLITNTYVSLAGVGLFVLASVGWIAQAVGEYRYAQSGGHGAHPVDDGAVPVDHLTVGQTH